jgi:cell division protease FtsH
MVTEYGFSDKLGRLRYSANEEEVFLGHSVTQQKNMSDNTADLIDSEIRALIEEAEETARRVLKERSDDLEKIAQALLEYETLSGKEVDALLNGEEIFRPSPEDPPAGAGRKSSVPTSGKKKRDSGKDAGGMEPEPQPGI